MCGCEYKTEELIQYILFLYLGTISVLVSVLKSFVIIQSSTKEKQQKQAVLFFHCPWTWKQIWNTNIFFISHTVCTSNEIVSYWNDGQMMALSCGHNTVKTVSVVHSEL